MLATAAAAAGGSGWRDGYVLLSTQRAKSTLTAPLLCKADEVSGTMRTVSAETVGAADGTAAGNADTCLRYAHGEDSQAHGAHSPPTHRRMPVSIAAPQAHGCASAAVHGAGSAVRRAHGHGVYLPRSAVQAVAAQHKAPCQSDSASAHVCVSAKSCMTSASLSARRQTVSSSYARKFPAVCMSVTKASAISDLGPKSAVALSAAAIDEFHQSFSLDLRQHESGGPGCQLTAHKVFVRESVLWGHGSNTVGQGRTCRRGGVRTASPGAHRRGTAGRPTRYSTSIERARSVGACACARREREGKGWGNTLKGSLLTAEELIVTARCRHSTPSP